MNSDLMRILVTLFMFVHTFALAQGSGEGLDVNFYESASTDTIFANTGPLNGHKSFQKKLETTLSEADTIGKKYLIRLNNIGFIVSKTGKIDSAWVIFHRRPIHREIIKQLQVTEWKAAEKDDAPVASRQELRLNIYLTKAVLKKHGCWPSFGERLFAPWIN
jgi:hypothetical protein